MKDTNPFTEVWQEFQKWTSEHMLTVLHDDGLYRHLRMAKPGTRMWSWEIVTWPGHLAVHGDISDGYIFAREPDMFPWFGYKPNWYTDGSPEISPDYWAWKLYGHAPVTDFDTGVFARSIAEYLQESTITENERANIIKTCYEDVYDFESAAQFLYDWFDGSHVGEFNCTTYKPRWLLTCYAITTTVNEWNVYAGH